MQRQRRELIKLVGVAFAGLAFPKLATKYILPTTPKPILSDPFLEAVIHGLETGPLSPVTQLRFMSLPRVPGSILYDALGKRWYEVKSAGVAWEVVPPTADFTLDQLAAWAAVRAGDGEGFLQSRYNKRTTMAQYCSRRVCEFIDTFLLEVCGANAERTVRRPFTTEAALMSNGIVVAHSAQYGKFLQAHEIGGGGPFKLPLVISDRRDSNAPPLVLSPRSFTVALDPQHGVPWEIIEEFEGIRVFALELNFGISIAGYDPTKKEFYDHGKIGMLRT